MTAVLQQMLDAVLAAPPNRPIMFDLCSKAGGASMGYHMAGFTVIGMDKEPQPNYPFTFIQADLLELEPEWLRMAHALAGSPPCQRFSVTRHRHASKGEQHPDLIKPTRELFEDSGLPYIIENVEGARPELLDPVQVCGSSFGLRVQRHRLFEANFPLQVPPCDHEWQQRHRVYEVRISKERAAVKGAHKQSGVMPVFGGRQLMPPADDLFEASVAMGINWMTKAELNQAIPPAYTLHLGRQLLSHVRKSS